MRILGLSSFKHDTAAAVLEDGVVKSAIENDKLARSRTRGLPEAAIRSCLERTGAGWLRVDKVEGAAIVFPKIVLDPFVLPPRFLTHCDDR